MKTYFTEMPSNHEFCDLLADARACGFGWAWSGSAYQCHPCGIIRGTIKLTNEWHVDDLCSVQITDGDGWSLDVHTDSRTNGNPHPRPINGKTIVAWNGREWESEAVRKAIEPRVLAILSEAREFCVNTRESRRKAQEELEERAAAAHSDAINKAIDKIMGAT